MKEFPGVKRVVTMQALGVGSSIGTVVWPMRMVMRYSEMSVGVRDHGMVEEEMKLEMEKGAVEWIGVRCAMLTEGEAKEVKVWGDEGKESGAWPSVTRGSVARWLVQCVEEAGRQWVRKTPVISN